MSGASSSKGRRMRRVVPHRGPPRTGPAPRGSGAPVALQVLARGDRWVVVDKPTGLAVHQSALVRDRDTVMRVARRQFGDEVDPVHRLDKATSGCLLLSLSRAHTAALHAAHVAGEKRYVAFVRGLLRGRVAADGPIRLDQPLNDDHGNPKSAVTLLTPIAGSVDPRSYL